MIAIRRAVCEARCGLSCNTFLGRIEATPEILERLRLYLLDQPCHADVLLEIANGPANAD